ncbi:unnamed protein product [Adineta steineri]|uniref:ATPase AAA-type core domain-containing protein n=1 Tax=Adineta steineri TaxID=433720 RepID=A0A818KC82_9BILA|nr:unnamed protein product [Adineta steineri]CAF3557641.1 unnamed protein product [Adineta steineri]
MDEEVSLICDKYTAYFPELSPAALQQLYVQSRSRDKIPAIRLFIGRYNAFPCLLSCTNVESNARFHITTILNYLKNEYQHNIINDVTVNRYHTKSKQFYTSSRLCDLGNGIMVFIKNIFIKSDIDNPNQYSPDLLDDYFIVSRIIAIYHLRHLDTEVENMAREFLKRSVFETKTLKFQMICRNRASEYYLTPINIKKPLIQDLALHYGQSFIKIHENILKELNKKDGKGIVLLYGIPGSGKTNYIRYLMDEIENKKLIYIPPDEAKDISKPEFLNFLLKHPNSILIIEDAENIIRDRNEPTVNSTQAVANLLNLSDGLLGDAMHMQIIATFNCDLTIVDKALLRKGRLIAHYNFQKLNVNDARILSEKLGFGTKNISTSMSLAEIYNQNEMNDIGETV